MLVYSAFKTDCSGGYNRISDNGVLLELISIFGVITMSKLSFRARALDATKPMAVYRSEEIPDLPDFAAINRAVPQMPTGMEKEEETVGFLSLSKPSFPLAAILDLARKFIRL